MTPDDRLATRALATVCGAGSLLCAAVLLTSPDELELSPGDWTIPGLFAALAIGLAVIARGK